MSRFYSRYNSDYERWEVCDTAGGIVGLAATGEAAQGEADRRNLELREPSEAPEQDRWPEPEPDEEPEQDSGQSLGM